MASPQPLEIKRTVRTIVYEGLSGRMDAIMERNVQDGEYRWAPGKVTVTTGTETPDDAYTRGLTDGWARAMDNKPRALAEEFAKGRKVGINLALTEIYGPRFAELSSQQIGILREDIRKELNDGLGD